MKANAVGNTFVFSRYLTHSLGKSALINHIGFNSLQPSQKVSLTAKAVAQYAAQKTATVDLTAIRYVAIFLDEDGTELFRQYLSPTEGKDINLIQPIDATDKLKAGKNYNQGDGKYFAGWQYSNNVNSNTNFYKMNYYDDSFTITQNDIVFGNTEEEYYYRATYQTPNDSHISPAKCQAVQLSTGEKVIRFYAMLDGNYANYSATGFVISTIKSYSYNELVTMDLSSGQQ